MPTEPDTSQRSTMLTVMLGALLALFFAVVLVLITGGFFLHVIAVAGGIFLVGMTHYALWGRALSEETAGEREEEELLRRAREEDE